MNSLFKNVNIVDKDGKRRGNVLVIGKRIAKIFSEGEKIDLNLYAPKDKTISIIDCQNLTMMPGFFDTHSHLRDPGFTYKEDINTGLKAAAKGGFTSVIAMANTNPVINTKEELEKQLEKLEEEAEVKIDLNQVAAVTKDFGLELNDLESLAENTLILSNDGKNIDDENIIREALERSKNFKVARIATHNEPETKTVERDIEILEEVGGRLHICHISKKETLEAIIKAKKKGLDITCEVTPHHLYASELDFKVHPPFRTEEDRLALIQGIKDGYIDTLGTDHAPHSKEDKENGSPGLINFESAFGMYNKVFNENDLSLSKLSEVNSYNPNKLFERNAGLIQEGLNADFVLVDPDEKWIFLDKDLESKSSNSPFFGEELLGKVYMTVYNGEPKYYGKHFFEEIPPNKKYPDIAGEKKLLKL